MIKQALIGIACGAAVLTIGMLIGHYGITSSSAPSWVTDVAKDVDESLIEKFLSEVDNIQIQENLRWVYEWSIKILFVILIIILFVQMVKKNWKREKWEKEADYERISTYWNVQAICVLGFHIKVSQSK